jgi:hypothetical protein
MVLQSIYMWLHQNTLNWPSSDQFFAFVDVHHLNAITEDGSKVIHSLCCPRPTGSVVLLTQNGSSFLTSMASNGG